MVARAFAAVMWQTKWQQCFKQIQDSRKEDWKPLPYSYNEDYFLDIVEPTLKGLMYSIVVIGFLLDFLIWRIRLAPGSLIFFFEIAYFILENNLPLDYGLYQSFVVTMQLLIIVTCFACQKGVCISVVTLVFFVVVFFLQPFVRATDNSFENSFDSIIAIFAVFLWSVMIMI